MTLENAVAQLNQLISTLDTGDHSLISNRIPKRITMQNLISTKITEGYRFGHLFLNKSVIVAHTSLSYASVNLKPITTGHLLIMPKRTVVRVSEMTRDELGDLWYLAQQMSVMLENKYQSQSTTFAIQDGKYAGQTIDHVHIHVVPRFPKDYAKNDDIYAELEKDAADDVQPIGVEDDARKTQTVEEMEAEALSYRKVIDVME